MIDDDRTGSHQRDDEFWGSTPDWTNDVERPRRKRRNDASGDITGAIKNLWGSAVTGGVSATRSHGVFDATAPRPVDGVADDIVAMPARRERTEVDDLYLEIDRAMTTEVPVVDARRRPPAAEMVVEPATPARRIDPLIARIGAVAIVTTLLVPLAIGLRSGDSDDTLASADTSAPVGTASEFVPPAASATPATPVSSEAVYLDPSDLPPAIPADSQTPTEPSVPVAASDATSTASTDGPVTRTASDAAVAIADSIEVKASDSTEVAVAQVVAVPVCVLDYIVQGGDYWIGIADRAGTPLTELLAVNGANVSTALYPGGDLCLPAGATIPSSTSAPAATPAATTTTATPTTAAPSTAEPSTTAAPTTASPTTTTPPPPPSPLGTEEVQQIIRDVWPDELEDRALTIAFRESRYSPTAKNFCCYGLFQIYWEVHDSWLGGIGVTSADQLYDPTTNARAAYALYQRAGGWGPWAQTDF